MTAQPSSSDRGNLWVIVPFALAIVGTVVMLFTNSANALKISLILALWAAAAGLIVIFRMRHDRDEATRALKQSEANHKEELARLERQPAAAAGGAGASPVDTELLRELQAEIKALRSQLEEMSGQVFEYEPAAVRAAARRIQELERPAEAEAAAAPTAPSEPAEPVEAPKAEPHKHETKGPSSFDTAKISVVRTPAPERANGSHRRGRPSGAPSSDAVRGNIGQQPQREQQNPLSALISERTKTETAAPKPEPKPQPQPQPEPEEYVGRHERGVEKRESDERRGGRRRRDAGREGSLSVSELLERNKR
ncbi:hypothetical protein MHK13_08430 [Corynebacterium hadale]|uniref:DUF6779 domain-containing protein n=1 Tax=Corynebacterium hadale TaxID=2026255 RepID=UPI001EF21559|nr:DUF6779 domain-containing protein [Corynebacterium hadale]MCG7254759.1 hypothetical protein [Corynebacterium hadale]MCG7257102.1 hypothetical protein [Corynebacterium hadale]MCG7265639.1 hypothetical protein [Corynebacterium hadale]